jgi:hypothetical protein
VQAIARIPGQLQCMSLKIKYLKRFLTFLHKKMFVRKSIFENFNISKNKIITFEAAKVLTR